jgi:hypothetical protein
LRQERRDTQERIDAARQFAKRAGGYESEAAEQVDRLASIKALAEEPDTGEWQWPFSERNLALESPVATVLLNELESLDKELRIATGQRPKLEAYLTDLAGKVDEIAGAIRQRGDGAIRGDLGQRGHRPDGHPQQRGRARGRPHQPVP